ncbi:MAG: M24 family metallopeptidase, partial [Gaiellaceae bacterium]
GFEADVLPYALYETLRDGGLDLVPVSGLVERMRAVKDADELATIRRAAEVTDRAYARMAEERFVGSTERALAWRMEQLFREEGADELAFDIIVASGPNGSRPHADSGERTVETGQTVVVDAGCRIGAYNSDCTRTFATGPLPERLREAYAVCLEAQLAGLEAVRAGERGKDVDALVREQIDRTEFHGMFGHGLGHGVGMLVHEQPRLAPTAPDDEVLRPGNVVTVEPGIYLEGLGGIRIEDLVVVTDDGAEVLSSYTKDLVTVD